MFRLSAAVAAGWCLASMSCGRPCKTQGAEDEICIAGGEFTMGHAPIDKAGNEWSPKHQVRLSPFFSLDLPSP